MRLFLGIGWLTNWHLICSKRQRSYFRKTIDYSWEDRPERMKEFRFIELQLWWINKVNISIDSMSKVWPSTQKKNMRVAWIRLFISVNQKDKQENHFYNKKKSWSFTMGIRRRPSRMLKGSLTCHCKLGPLHLEVWPNWCSVGDLWYHMFYNEYSFERWSVVDVRRTHFPRIRIRLEPEEFLLKTTNYSSFYLLDNNAVRVHRTRVDSLPLEYYRLSRSDELVRHCRDWCSLMIHLTGDRMSKRYLV